MQLPLIARHFGGMFDWSARVDDLPSGRVTVTSTVTSPLALK